MNPFNPETWKKEWTAISSAPFSMLVAIMVVGWIIWWFQGKLSEAQIAGLKEQVSVMEQRLKLASEQAGIANRAENELAKQIRTLGTAIEAKADNYSLSALAAKVKAKFVKLTTANNALSSTLSSTVSIASVSTVSVSAEVVRAMDAPN